MRRIQPQEFIFVVVQPEVAAGNLQNLGSIELVPGE
jgi:hypothetical protein